MYYSSYFSPPQNYFLIFRHREKWSSENRGGEKFLKIFLVIFKINTYPFLKFFLIYKKLKFFSESKVGVKAPDYFLKMWRKTNFL